MIRTERASGFSSALLLVAVVSVIVLTFVMFFGNIALSSEQTEKPEPTVEFNYTAHAEADDTLRIEHVEGARVNPAQLAVGVSGAGCSGAGEPNGQYAADEDFGLTENNWLSPGMALVVDGQNPAQLCDSGTFTLEDATVELLWENPDGEFETITSWEP